jgi:hypothetical protein
MKLIQFVFLERNKKEEMLNKAHFFIKLKSACSVLGMGSEAKDTIIHE